MACAAYPGLSAQVVLPQRGCVGMGATPLGLDGNWPPPRVARKLATLGFAYEIPSGYQNGVCSIPSSASLCSGKSGVCGGSSGVCGGVTDFCGGVTDVCGGVTDVCSRVTDVCIRVSELCGGSSGVCGGVTDVCGGITDACGARSEARRALSEAPNPGVRRLPWGTTSARSGCGSGPTTLGLLPHPSEPGRRAAAPGGPSWRRPPP